MLGKIDAPILFFAPFVSSVMRVEPRWIDYNGHLNVTYYSLLFDRAVDECYALIGIGEHYAATRNGSLFAAEAHLSYRRELAAEEAVRVTVQLLDFDEKRLRYFMELRQAHEGWLAATSENLSLHVDLTTRRVAPFPDDVLATLALMKAVHSRLPTPESAGRGVVMRRQLAHEPQARRH
jgi:acyl-CoA thioester hydrolase